MYSSTTRARISRWRGVSPAAARLGQQVSCHAAAEHASTWRERERRPAAGDQPQALQSVEGGGVEHVRDPVDEERLVEAEAEHHALALPNVQRERLELPLG